MTNKLLDSLKKMIEVYGEMHDGLSDMVEEGRLKESDIPDDYQWLVDSLANAAHVIRQAEEIAAKAKGE